MKRVGSFLYLSVFFSLASWASSETINKSSPSCQTKGDPVEIRFKINDSPQYFYKITPDGKYLAYIGSNGNRLISLDPFDEQNISVLLPGTIDPVFTPDGKLLMVPMRASSFGETKQNEQNQDDSSYSMSFYDSKDFKNLAEKNHPQKDEHSKKIFSNTMLRDKDLSGVYQTAGIIGQEGNASQYKVITDKDGVTLREYSYDSKNKTVEAIGAPYKPCPALKEVKFDTPVLSKDGKFLSVRNQASNTTQIYHLQEKEQCKLALDVGVVTGKVAFSFDNQRLAFHVDEMVEAQGYFSGVKRNMTKNIYVMNVEQEIASDGTVKFKPISWARASSNTELGMGSYYPEFTKDGKLIYLSDKNNYFEFEKINPNKLVYAPYFRVESKVDATGKPCTSCQEDELTPALALGALWAQVCAVTDKVRPKDAMLMAMSLTEGSCKDLVNSGFNKSLVEVYKGRWSDKKIKMTQEIRAEDLFALCSKDHSKVTAKELGKWEEKKVITEVSELVKQKCISCHQGPVVAKADLPVRRFYNEKGEIVGEDMESQEVTIPSFANLNKIDTATAYYMLEAVNHPDPSKRMPRGGSLSTQESEIISRYVNEIGSDDPDTWEELSPVYAFKYSEQATGKALDESVAAITDPAQKKSAKESIEPYYKCLYMQAGCDTYLQKSRTALVEKLHASGLNGEELEKQVQRELLTLQCQVRYKTNKKMCKGIM